MSNARWQRISHLYHAALERPANARAEFLREVCADDPALLHEVQSLVDQPISAEQFLAAGSLGERDPSFVRVGQRLGVYQVQALLGGGGMVEVYRARDTSNGHPQLAGRVAQWQEMIRDVSARHLSFAFMSATDCRIDAACSFVKLIEIPAISSI